MVQVPLKEYTYANSRVRAMASRLLDETTFQQVIEASDYNRALGVLEDTEYGPDIEEAILEGFRPTSIDRAFNHNLMRNFNKIKDFFIGRPEELLKALLSRWDLYNLKTILRGMRALVPKAEITRNLVPIGALDLVVLEEILNQPDLRASLDAIVMFSPQWMIPYGQAITAVMPRYLQKNDLAMIETSLDEFHYKRVSSVVKGGDSNSKLVRRVVDMEIDIINITTLLRICGLELEEKEAGSYYIPGGILSSDDFDRILQRKRVEDLVDVLISETPYGEPLRRAEKSFEEKGESVFQDELDKFMIRKCLHITAEPLGIGIIIMYIWRKYLEIKNLRIIIRGKSIGLIESQIRKELVLMDEEEK
ncbi:MAG: V-type ATPase subunit [Actinomycetota bacterium]|nr:V-type ATPase subunit [Actinomycetota bacterium]